MKTKKEYHEIKLNSSKVRATYIPEEDNPSF
jgi:hypothetical protein